MARPRSDISARILHAARERFLKDGVDGASLRRIARDARTSIGMIYYYFPTKNDLFFGVVEEIYAHLLEDFSEALAPNAGTSERIRRLYVRIGHATPDEIKILRLVAREALTSSARRARLIERFMRGHIAMVLSVVIDGIGDGSLRRDLHPALLLMATFGVGAVPQVARRIAADQFPFADAPAGDDFSEQLVRLLFEGVGGAGHKPHASAKSARKS
jgi:AcrR family transcriptional regulator